jgi:hypothetical protein
MFFGSTCLYDVGSCFGIVSAIDNGLSRELSALCPELDVPCLTNALRSLPIF